MKRNCNRDKISQQNHMIGQEDRHMEDAYKSYPQKRLITDKIRLVFLIWVADRMCKMKITGLENLCDNMSYIFAPNHSSHLDTMCVYKGLYKKYGGSYFDKMCCMAVKELEKGYMKKIFRTIGAIPVERNSNAINSLKSINKVLTNNGYSVLIFPEGTRTRNGKMGSFLKGAAVMSVYSNIPIIPVGIKGTYEIWPANSFPKLSFKRKIVEVHFGQPINKKGTNASELTQILEKEVSKLCEEKQ